MKDINLEGIDGKFNLEEYRFGAILTREVAKTGTGGYISFSKDYIGEKVWILVPKEVYDKIAKTKVKMGKRKKENQY